MFLKFKLIKLYYHSKLTFYLTPCIIHNILQQSLDVLKIKFYFISGTVHNSKEIFNFKMKQLRDTIDSISND